MEVKASLKNLRMSARKTRLVVDLVRGLEVENALNQLQFMNKAAALPVKKLIESALANAENTYNLERSNLMIKEIKVDKGFILKRWLPRAHGRATPLRKQGCHISVVLKEIKETEKKEKKVQEIEKPLKLEDLSQEADKAKETLQSKKSRKIKKDSVAKKEAKLATASKKEITVDRKKESIIKKDKDNKK